MNIREHCRQLRPYRDYREQWTDEEGLTREERLEIKRRAILRWKRKQEAARAASPANVVKLLERG